MIRRLKTAGLEYISNMSANITVGLIQLSLIFFLILSFSKSNSFLSLSFLKSNSFNFLLKKYKDIEVTTFLVTYSKDLLS